MVHLVRAGVALMSHAGCPAPPFGFGDMLERMASRVAPAGTKLTWVDSAFLRERGEDDASLPLWPGADDSSDINAGDPARAYAAGLAPRPLGDSVDDVHAGIGRAHV